MGEHVGRGGGTAAGPGVFAEGSGRQLGQACALRLNRAGMAQARETGAWKAGARGGAGKHSGRLASRGSMRSGPGATASHERAT